MSQRQPLEPRRCTTSSDEAAASPREVDRKLQKKIGAQLRAIYQATLDEPVPPRFVELLAELERKQKPRN